MRARALAGFFLFAVVLAGVWELSRFAASRADVPDDDDVKAVAAALVDAHLGAGDVVVVAPPWSMSLQQQLGPMASLTVAADGPWDALHQRRHRRVFLYDEPDATPWLAEREHPVLSVPASTFGALRLRVVDDGVAPFDFKDRFDRAEVSIVDDAGAVVACAQHSAGVGGGVRCAGEPRRVRVAREWSLVTENGADVVVVVPPSAGKRLRLRYRDVPLQEFLVMALGHTQQAVAAFHGQADAGAATLRIEVDGDELQVIRKRPFFVIEPHRAAARNAFVGDLNQGRSSSVMDAGFVAQRVDTSAYAGRRVDVTFEFVADSADKNAFAFDAFVPAPSPP